MAGEKLIQKALNAVGGAFKPTETGWIFKDVKNPNLTPAQNRAITHAIDAGRYSEQELPIRSMYATQPHVNEDFAAPVSSNRGNLPVVQRIGDEFYVRDGHHRLTKLATEGAETAKVNLVDPWERTPTDMPLLDWKPKTPEQIASERALAQRQKQENDDLYNDLMSLGFGDFPHKARGGHVDAALHAVRHHFAGGGMLSGPDYLSTGKEASFANLDPNNETNADFFKADRALRLAREIQAKADVEANRPPISEEAVAAAPRLARASLRVKEEEPPVSFAAPPQPYRLDPSDTSPPPSYVRNYVLPAAAAARQEIPPQATALMQGQKISTRAPSDSDYSPVLAAISMNESRNKVNAQNAKSSAGGLYQFLNSTWGNILRRMDPENYGHLTDTQLSGFKLKPEYADLQHAAADFHLKNDILPRLGRAGIEATPGSIYLSWFQGPAGAVRANTAPRNATVSEIFPETVSANSNMRFKGKSYADWTMDDLRQWAETSMANRMGRAEGGEVDAALRIARRHFDGSDGSFVDPMGSIGIPAVGPEEESQPVAVDNAERLQAAARAAELAKQIQAYDASMSGIRQQPQDIQSMTHAPEKPRAPISVEALGKNREFGSAPYDVANPLSTLAQGAYDMKTMPLYAAGMAFPPAAALGTALDTAEGVATGSPTQVAMGAFGSPVKLAKSVIAPLAVATGVGAPDEAEAARLPRIGGVASALSKVGPKAADASLEQALNVVRQAAPQRELSPMGFYSHGAETAAALQQAKGTPEQFAAMLQKAGVKPAEMEGFGEAFAGRPSVTRDEIAAHFKERMPQIEETVLGQKREPLSYEDWVKTNYRTTYDRMMRAREENDAETFAMLKQQLDREWNAGMGKRFSGDTKFSQYSLPGGENYREVLLKLPEGYGAPKQALDDLAAARQRLKDLDKRHGDELEAGLTGDMNMSYEDFDKLTRERDIAAARVKNFEKLANQPAFQSGHWQDPNVLAHLRMADRTGPNGEKILHVEEIQSDWGQKGKKEGFVTQYKPEDIKPMDPANITSERRRNEFWNFETPTGAIDVPRNDRWPTIEAARQHILDNVKPTGIPTAPYVTNTQAWTDLALKRALREAAEGGYEKLVWTPGAEQAKRYDLSQQISGLRYYPEKNALVYRKADGDQWLTGGAQRNVKPEDLSNYVGKEVAEKLLAQKTDEHGIKELNGMDLSVGGEGMKGYYDKIVPTQLSKLVKKLDPEAKVGMTDVMLPPKGGIGHNNPPLEAPGITITPKMREAILGGQTAFAEGGLVARALEISRKG